LWRENNIIKAVAERELVRASAASYLIRNATDGQSEGQTKKLTMFLFHQYFACKISIALLKTPLEFWLTVR